jgi:N,N'-diacetyllegionaminate synthase
MEGPDHKASLEPNELKKMVQAIRKVEQALGNGIKKPSKSEARNIPIVRKSIVAARDIKVGELFSADNIMSKRPGNGISPMRWDEMLGKVAQKNYKCDDLI